MSVYGVTRQQWFELTDWGRETHICIGNLTTICSDNGLSPGRRQTIIWTNAGLLSIGPLRTNFSEILIKMHNFPFTKMHLKRSSAKWRPFCPGGDELIRPSDATLHQRSVNNGSGKWHQAFTWTNAVLLSMFSTLYAAVPLFATSAYASTGGISVYLTEAYLIETETKWHFQMHFLEWKCMNFDQDFIEVCS